MSVIKQRCKTLNIKLIQANKSSSKGLGECWTSLEYYEEAIKHHKKRALSQPQALSHSQQPNATRIGSRPSLRQASAVINIGVTLWTHALAEHHAALASADYLACITFLILKDQEESSWHEKKVAEEMALKFMEKHLIITMHNVRH